MSREKVQLIMRGVLSSERDTSGEISTGLGLRLCMEYAKKNGGRVKINSEERKGTEITCYLLIA